MIGGGVWSLPQSTFTSEQDAIPTWKMVESEFKSQRLQLDE